MVSTARSAGHVFRATIEGIHSAEHVGGGGSSLRPTYNRSEDARPNAAGFLHVISEKKEHIIMKIHKPYHSRDQHDTHTL